jgi:hypothetical protein
MRMGCNGAWEEGIYRVEKAISSTIAIMKSSEYSLL